jgi:SPP1 gp7 family putative phage head morphogenesis protein
MPRRHPLHSVNGRLASHAGTVQMDLLGHADALANTAETAIRHAWNELWKLLKDAETLNVYAVAQRHFQQLFAVLVNDLGHGLSNLATWSHNRTAGYLADTIPLPYLHVALAPKILAQAFTEASPGLVSFARADIDLATADLISAHEIGDDAKAREIFQAILFPAPPLQRLQQIIYSGAGGAPWTERLRSETKLAAPDAIANILAAGFAAGLGPRAIAQQLQPVVGDVSATARRIARTEGMRVAHAIQWEANQAIASMTLGHQVHAQLDQNTRPLHRIRNGNIYYADPKPGQRGYDEMPHPPMEADGTVAHNCRCWTSVVLAPPSRITSNPESMKLFDDHAAKAIPDPHVYGQWFAQAPEYLRRKAVGTARYSAAKEVMGRDPDWAHFWSPSKNRLLTAKEIAREEPKKLAKRLEKVRKQEARQRADLAKMATYGFLVP